MMIDVLVGRRYFDENWSRAAGFLLTTCAFQLLTILQRIFVYELFRNRAPRISAGIRCKTERVL
jgi:hypothetical protein